MDFPGLIRKTTCFFAALCILLALTGLLFRATFYWDFPVHPGDPYGLGDIIEMAIYMVLLCVAGFTLVLSCVVLALPKCRNIRLVVFAFLSALMSWAAYYYLIGYVQRLF